MGRVKSQVKSVEDTLSVCLQNNLTFAAFRLPNKDQAEIIIQKNNGADEVEDLSKVTKLNGFLVAPFLHSNDNRMFIIKPDYYFKGEIEARQFAKIKKIKHPEKENHLPGIPYEASKEEYLEQIGIITGAIENNEVQKVVLSRVKVVKHESENQLHEIFANLCSRFSNAFVYLFNANGQLWMGATPEPFAFLREN
ncbi:MAG TPA: chorismate-binding protein, partial [Prolixibacteraceae bacterium]|nr:chorismate-binding protein [Prolixibacteraceae bacterium]